MLRCGSGKVGPGLIRHARSVAGARRRDGVVASIPSRSRKEQGRRRSITPTALPAPDIEIGLRRPVSTACPGMSRANGMQITLAAKKPGAQKVAASSWGRGNLSLDYVSFLAAVLTIPRVFPTKADRRRGPIHRAQRCECNAPRIGNLVSGRWRRVPAGRRRRSAASMLPRCGRRCGTSPMQTGTPRFASALLAWVVAPRAGRMR